jgi:hypothetical protein
MHFQSSTAPRCAICGLEVSPDFSFDLTPTQLVHPDCFAFTHSAEVGIPSRTLPPGTRPIHTCGDEHCMNPEHML